MNCIAMICLPPLRPLIEKDLTRSEQRAYRHTVLGNIVDCRPTNLSLNFTWEVKASQLAQRRFPPGARYHWYNICIPQWLTNLRNAKIFRDNCLISFVHVVQLLLGLWTVQCIIRPKLVFIFHR